MTAARQSANINRICLEPMVAVLGAMDVAQVGRAVLIMDMLLNLSEFRGRRSIRPSIARKRVRS